MTTNTNNDSHWQTLVNEAHAEWNSGMPFVDVFDHLPSARHADALVFAKMNYQVGNGGWTQWDGNGYSKAWGQLEAALGRAIAFTKEHGMQEEHRVFARVDGILSKVAKEISRDYSDCGCPGYDCDCYDYDHGNEDALDALDEEFYSLEFTDVGIAYFDRVALEAAVSLERDLDAAEHADASAVSAVECIAAAVRMDDDHRVVEELAEAVSYLHECSEDTVVRLRADHLVALIERTINAIEN